MLQLCVSSVPTRFFRLSEIGHGRLLRACQRPICGRQGSCRSGQASYRHNHVALGESSFHLFRCFFENSERRARGWAPRIPLHLIPVVAAKSERSRGLNRASSVQLARTFAQCLYVTSGRTHPGTAGERLANSGSAIRIENHGVGMHETRRSQLVMVYSLALLAPAITLLLRWPLEVVLGDRVLYMAFIPAILIVAYVGGLWPGLITTVLSALAATYAYFLVSPFHSFEITTAPNAVALCLLLLIGTIISVLSESLHRTWRGEVRSAHAERTVQLHGGETRYPQGRLGCLDPCLCLAATRRPRSRRCTRSVWLRISPCANGWRKNCAWR